MKETEIKKTYSLRMTKKKELEIFQKFHDIVVHSGESQKDVVIGLMDEYNKLCDPGIKLVSEKDLVEKLRQLGYKTTQGTLKKFRYKGILDVPKNSEFRYFYTNKDGSVIYDLKRMIQFIRSRNSN